MLSNDTSKPQPDIDKILIPIYGLALIYSHFKTDKSLQGIQLLIPFFPNFTGKTKDLKLHNLKKLWDAYSAARKFTWQKLIT